MKRYVLSLFSALVLAAGLLISSAAAAGIQLVTDSAPAPSQAVALSGISPSCQSLQVTLSLSGDGTTYTYLPDSGLNRNGIYTTSRQEGSQVTIYITAKRGVLTESGSLELGTLSTTDGTLFTITGYSGLLMTDSASTELPGEDSGSSGQQPGTGGGSSSGGSGGAGEDAGASETPSLPFADVAKDTWYTQAVEYVYEKGLMTGTAEDRFSPDMTTSRAMIVTMLYRLEGSPAVSGGTAFSDVAPNQWYAGAVAWASANGVISGYGNGSFGPEDTITREQLATIFCRYAAYKGAPGVTPAPLEGYTDAAQISPYATEAMSWAIGAGLITGTGDTTLSPTGFATRAQAAVILSRFCQNLDV